jgi:hypothetical protein
MVFTLTAPALLIRSQSKVHYIVARHILGQTCPARFVYAGYDWSNKEDLPDEEDSYDSFTLRASSRFAVFFCRSGSRSHRLPQETSCGNGASHASARYVETYRLTNG